MLEPTELQIRLELVLDVARQRPALGRQQSSIVVEDGKLAAWRLDRAAAMRAIAAAPSAPLLAGVSSATRTLPSPAEGEPE